MEIQFKATRSVHFLCIRSAIIYLYLRLPELCKGHCLNMSSYPSRQIQQLETTCGSLLSELQKIWDEVGESEADRDKMLYDLEQECLEIYRRKVEEANQNRAQLRKVIADAKAEIAHICSALNEDLACARQSARSLKEEMEAIAHEVEQMQEKKIRRRNEIVEVLDQIQAVSKEIYSPEDESHYDVILDETDLSLKKLEELRKALSGLQKEKSDRLKLVLDHLKTLDTLCLVLGLDFKQKVAEVHPSLDESSGSKNLSCDTIERLAAAIQSLREIKIERMQKLQDLGTSMLELWTLMDTPMEEQQMFQRVTCNIAATEDEITEPNSLSSNFIKFAEDEVLRLEGLKSSKMKDLILKKQLELEELLRRAHMVCEADSAKEYSVEAIESGALDPVSLMEQIEHQIEEAKGDAFSRNDILEKVDKWLAACEEECWLEEYTMDDNRYNAGRGAHLALKRAEKARAIITKIPAMVEALTVKTTAWEKEKGKEFLYDGVRLLSMLNQYSVIRQEKERERQRQRDQKKLQEQLIVEQEALFGSKPSPTKNIKGAPKNVAGWAARRFSLGGIMLQTPMNEKVAVCSRPTRKIDLLNRKSPLNYNQDGHSPALSSGKRKENAGRPIRKHSTSNANAHRAEPSVIRKPFSPIPSATISSNANITNTLEDHEKNLMLQKTNISNGTPLAPSKLFPVKEVTETPRTMPNPIPLTPPTVSVPMQTATTMITPSVLYGATRVDDIPEHIELSFEERRAGFIPPKPHVRPVLQL
ncbi:hypothetical protein RJ641_016160 [Dillenia turbinata]|uniref:65-kDa microtubule-associated protein 3 n=1 Tax=Dillenia turbinata TaxID=194707 RepID=A0AAN8UYB5_9MAGN